MANIRSEIFPKRKFVKEYEGNMKNNDGDMKKYEENHWRIFPWPLVVFVLTYMDSCDAYFCKWKFGGGILLK